MRFLTRCWSAMLLAACNATSAASLAISNFSLPLDGRVYSLAVQHDGGILVGGYDIHSLAGCPVENLGRLNAGGELDRGFRPKGASLVTAMAVQSDGGTLISGYITNLAGKFCVNLARLNPLGTADLFFKSPNPNDVMLAFGAQPDEKTIVAGAFTHIAGGTNRFIARINPNGSVDHTFNAVPNAAVIDVAVQRDGKVVIAGVFTSLGGISRNGLARVNSDGTLDLQFNPAVGGEPWSMALQSDGKVLVSFPRPLANYSTNTFVVRLNTDGSLDSNFNASVHIPVNSFAEQADGKILMLTGAGLTRLNADGTQDESIVQSSPEYLSMALKADGEIILAGSSLEARTNTSVAKSSLSYDGATALWSFGPTAASVPWASMDYTTNGVDWVDLGQATRTAEGWQLSGLKLIAGGTLRAKGPVSGGYFNGSLWFAQSYFGSPAILEQPSNVTNYVGTAARLRVYAGASEPINYQWFHEGIILPNATNAVLTIPSVHPSGGGHYFVVVSNQFGSVTSSAVSLTVRPLPEIIMNAGNFGTTNGQFGFSARGSPGQSIVIEWTGNYLNWKPVQTNVLETGTFYFNQPISYPRQFYRVRVVD